MRIEPAARIDGHIAVPGDKSISHRAVLSGRSAEGETPSAVRPLRRHRVDRPRVRALGVAGRRGGRRHARVTGAGLRGLAGAGRADRLRQRRHARSAWSPGSSPARRGAFELAGDESLSPRPMGRDRRAARPDGRGVETADGRLPLGVEGAPLAGDRVRAARRERAGEVCVLLAGLYARGEDDRGRARADPRPHRADARGRRARTSRAAPGRSRRAAPSGSALGEVEVPGDISSAAPFVLAADAAPGSELMVAGVGVNPRRTGFLDVLERMGARIGVFNRRTAARRAGRRPRGRAAELVATRSTPDEVPRLVDELPLFALAASMAHGDSASAARRSCADEGDRPDRGRRRPACAALGAHIEERAGRVQRPRRADAPPRRARWRPPATTGSRCSAPSPGRSRRLRSRSRGGVELPGSRASRGGRW